MKTQTTVSKLGDIILPKKALTRAVRLALGSFLFVALIASASEAQQRTFVSGLGNDGNPCNRTAPCRTFTQAILLTNPGGEVVVLDSAGYGPFAITKAVTVQAPPGVYAGISVFSGNGININAGGTDTVILRGLTVNNQGSINGSGIVFNSGAELHVESCVVNGFTSGAGLFFGNPGQLEVKDSIMRGNTTGIAVEPTSGTAFASIDRVRLEGSSTGLLVLDRSMVTISDSLVSGNPAAGFQVSSNTAFAAALDVENCMLSGNGDGLQVSSSSTGVSTVRISNSIVTQNSIGLHNVGSPAVLLSRGNNTVEGNTTNASGTIGSYSAK